MFENNGANRRSVLRKFLCMAACAVGLALTSVPSANAAFINLTGGTAGSIPGGAINEFIPLLFAGPTIGGYYGSQITLDVPTQSLVTIDFFGAEAGFVNKFYLNGSKLFTHNGGLNIAPNLGSPLGTFSTDTLASGLLPLRFSYNSGAGSVFNGSNPDDSAGQSTSANFFASCNPFSGVVGSGGTGCSSVYLFLDDGGAGPDDNHDDFLVRISVSSDLSEVPEPGSMTLLGLGLLGAAFAGRRIRSSRS